MITFLVVVAAAASCALTVWAAIRHQLRYSAAHPAKPTPAPHDPDRAVVAEARRMAEAFVFDPAHVVDVPEKALLSNPVSWHGRTIRVRATWTVGLESSLVAGAFALPRVDIKLPHGKHRVIAEGLWIFPRSPRHIEARTFPGFGHMGMSWGEFHVYRVGPDGPSLGHTEIAT